MKVAYVLGALNRGGTETLSLDVFNNLKDESCELVGIYRKEGALSADFKQSKHPLFYVPFSMKIIKYLFSLRKCLKTENVEIAHSQQAWTSVILFFATLFTDIKIITSIHGFDYPYGWVKKFTIFLSFWISKKTVFVSHYQKDYYEKKYWLDKRRNLVIYNGVNFDKVISKKHAKPDFISDNFRCPKIGMVGNFVDGRDQFFICECLDRINEQGIDFQFYFIGAKASNKPELYDRCFSYCKTNGLLDRVHFVGSRRDVSDILHYLDLFLYATEHDTFGLAVIEAIASKTPVFVNDWGVFREISEDGKLVWLYPTRNIEVCVSLLKSYFANPELFTEEAKKKSVGIRKYCIENHILQLLQLYKTL